MENLKEQIQELQKIIDTYDNIVFFGGAGVSTESGIPDFRSVDGLYHQQYDYPPETILSHSFYRSHPEEFFRFYRNKMLFPKAQPNAAHKKLAELERAGKVRAVITQNIDGLHQAAGSKTVLELHGSVLRNYCEKCHQFYGLNAILNSTGIPHCRERECQISKKQSRCSKEPPIILPEPVWLHPPFFLRKERLRWHCTIPWQLTG